MNAFSESKTAKSIFTVSVLTLLMFLCYVTWAADNGAKNPFENGWKLDSAASSLNFQTVSQGVDDDGSKTGVSILENNSFDSFEGSVDESGSASLRVQLDSVVTDDDLRNVRLRFLLFETYKFAEAVVSTKIDPDALSDLSEKDSIELPLEFELDLHGVKQSFQMDTTVTTMPDGQVSVASVEPVTIDTSLFDLDSGVKKLEDSSSLAVVPMGAVSFDLIFDTQGGAGSGTETEDQQTEGEQAEVELAEGEKVEGKDEAEMAEGEKVEDKDEAEMAEGEKVEGKDEAEMAEGEKVEGTDDAEMAEGEKVEGKDDAEMAEGEKVEDKEEADQADASVSNKTSDEVVAKADTAVVPVAVPVEIPTSAEPSAVEPDWADEATYTSPYAAPESDTEADKQLSEKQCAERFEDFSKSGGIYFKSASASLDPKSVDVLSAIVEVANRCSKFKLTVAGHTDSTGSRKSNQRLSEQRALSVSEYLINNNVDRQRLSAVGFGETKPLVPNDTRSNRERNRRIEFTVAN